ncbi:MAG: pyridoxamine 5'-phosphate oxidase family protein [Deltaproteobacteria bacterium]|nr:pyridoxamine 5'-phosphate oxidase family protein [Deltaproteobacteria bacterium]
MAKMPRQVLEKFNDPRAVKFLASVDEAGKPNVVYIGSLRAVDEETLIYADSAGVKTKKNLQPGNPVAVNVLLLEKVTSYQVKGIFVGFETSGPYFEMLSELPEFKYNTYFGVRAAGVIRVDEVYAASSPLPGRRIVPSEPYLNLMEE